jgi:transposase
MIRAPMRVLVAAQPVDLRLSFDRLAGLVASQLQADPRSELLVVFHNKRRTHVKLLWHDGTGYCLFFKRLDRGQFRIPEAQSRETRQITITKRELEILLEGIDMAAVRAAQRSLREASRSTHLSRNAG